MAYEHLCMYCFEDLEGKTICPHCGRDARAAVPQVQLLPGTLVYHERFLIGRALGQDATGIVYSAFDTKRQNKLRIREYLPRDCAERLNDGAVVPVAGMEDRFAAGLKKLKASVESVEDPRQRHFFFEENGTAYIAQRKSAAAAAAEPEEEEEEESGGRRRVLVIVIIALAVLLAAAVALITLFNGLTDTSKDVTLNPTFDPNSVWIPVESPTPTPYVSPTFAALVDPDLSWMDYTYEGDVDTEYQQQQKVTRTATPKPTVSNDSSGYTSVSARSTSSEIRALQQKLVTLGWLDYNKISGEYDSATKQAVRDFQSYVNEAYEPARPLTVDGLAGPKTLQWLYETAAARPTATPTPRVTAAPERSENIDENASRTEIRAVQRMLVTLGLMPEGSANGRYDASTRKAVERFQTRVNDLAGYEALEVSGDVDPLTLAFMNYYVDEWETLRKATQAPTPTPTPSPKPTDTPSPRPTEEISEVDTTTIDQNAEPESIARVQQMLINIGMLPEGSADGKYGSKTIAAVADFQQWVNDKRKEETLTVSGIVDPLTRLYLEYCDDRDMRPYGTPTPAPTAVPTATPVPTAVPTDTPEPTEEPIVLPTEVPVDPDDPEEGEQEITITRNSDPESIRFVQQMLSNVGFLTSGGVDGKYGRGTAGAVQAFQEWFNTIQDQIRLPVTGEVDNQTRLALEYCSDHEITLESMATPGPTMVPIDETEAPDAQTDEAPTEEPTEEPTPEPTEAPQKAEVRDVQVAVGEVLAGDDVIAVNKGRFPVRWEAEGDVGSYYVYVQDENGKDIIHEEATDATSFNVNTEYMEPGVVYTLRVGALPKGGGEDDMVWRTVRFMLPAAPTPEPAPQVGEVSAPGIAVDGERAEDSTVTIEDEEFQIAWNAEGDVAGYSVRITDADGNVITENANTTQTSIGVKASQMRPGMVYTIIVGAVPVNGGAEDIVWSRGQFTLPAALTEAPTEAPTPTPEPTEAPRAAEIGRPVINVGGTAYQRDGVTVVTDSTAIFSWTADGRVESYTIYVENEAGDRQPLGTTTDTSRTVNTDNLPAGFYTIYVGALPENGTEDDMQWSSYRFAIPAPTAQPTEVPTPAPAGENPEATRVTISGPVSGESDADTIRQLQLRLYALGLLPTDATEGVLDHATLQAVAEFQQQFNESYGEDVLTVIDASDLTSVIDANTLLALFGEN